MSSELAKPSVDLVTIAPVVSPAHAVSRLVAALTSDVLAVLALAGVLFCLRLALHWSLRSYVGTDVTGGVIAAALAQGLRFDVQVAAVAVLPCVVLSLMSSGWPLTNGFWLRFRERMRRTTWVVVVWSSAVLSVGDGLYFKEFGAPFDARLFEPLQEDNAALAATVWASYPVMWITVGCVALGFLVWWVSRRALLSESRAWSLWAAVRPSPQWLILGCLVPLLVVAVRGSIGYRPLQSGTATVTADRTLNRLTPSPWHALRTAIRDHLQTLDAERLGGKAFAGVDLVAACRAVLGTVTDDRSLDQASRRQIHETNGPAPRHIILVVMESESGWPLMERHRALGLMPELASLAERGASVSRFVSAGSGTIYSLGPLFTGIPDCGIAQTLTPTTRTPFPTSLAPAFRRLGYRTRFFYGGFLASKRYGDFAIDQGFEEVLGEREVTSTRRRNSWGVDDADLYALVGKTLNDRQPTFSVILTTSNHPPFEVDLATTPFDATTLAARSGVTDPEAIRALGHLWYADHCAGAFVRAIEPRLPGLLVTLVGDHYGRRFLNGVPDAAERTAVPCVFYGPTVLAGRRCPPRMVGSHLDLLPTLIALAAPVGFDYHAWGHDLFGPEAAWSIGNMAVVTPGRWVDVSSGNSPAESGVAETDFLNDQKLCDDYRALGWWRLIHGPLLPKR